MLDAGARLVGERGITVGLAGVRLEDAMIAADAPRASTYRAWSTDNKDDSPQQRFHRELTIALLLEHPAGGSESLAATVEAVAKADPPASPEHTAALTPPERALRLRRVLHSGADANQLHMESDRRWGAAIAIAAGLSTQEDIDEATLEAWTKGETELSTRYEDLYRSTATLFGWRLRKPYTWAQFGTVAAALAEGLAIRSAVNPNCRGILRNTGPSGEPEEWTLFAIGFEGLLRQFWEPDPGVDWAATLPHET